MDKGRLLTVSRISGGVTCRLAGVAAEGDETAGCVAAAAASAGPGATRHLWGSPVPVGVGPGHTGWSGGDARRQGPS